MTIEAEIREILASHGAVLVRSKKHAVWRFPDGRCFTVSKSSSDTRVMYNQLSDLKRVLGLKNTGSRPPASSPSSTKPVRVPAVPLVASPKPHVDGARMNKLKLAGLKEAPLNERVSALLDELRSERKSR